ncbi:hypothetical protein AXF42_Ash021374 [Apostasia shenzhenica]|uniref:Uncharacterized protein n=1 Tax=Apostasia shenzhenica TaxID=1088818 RepID=A0A2H9ZRU0_9ASPA|nr:hypothetical protein AXF42_Ash021374 [Apostasia shenzhenica]
MWEKLIELHEGTSEVKRAKKALYKNQFDNFKIREGEFVAQIHSRFKEIYHGLVGLGDNLENREVVCKVLEVFPRTQLWVGKVDAIGVSQNLDTYKIDELFSHMELHETRYGGEKEVKKDIALVAEEEVSKKPSSSPSPKLSRKPIEDIFFM